MECLRFCSRCGERIEARLELSSIFDELDSLDSITSLSIDRGVFMKVQEVVGGLERVV
ncbi:MAG: hypothetical protein ACTSXC_03575 [Candidatus Freyarchaeota archaeon]